jgi:hypothetical protein
MRRAEGGANIFGVFRVKNHDFTPKNNIFSNFRGRGGAPGAPPGSVPVVFKLIYRISGVMVSVLDSSAVDRGFEPRSGQTKDYNIGICCFSAKHASFR